MTNDSTVGFTSGPPETVLPAGPPEVVQAVAAAERLEGDARRAALASVAAANPTYVDAWARLSSVARDPVEAYAYARVGYHRGLDQLRAAGWRGSGYVRWDHETNRGFLRALDALRAAASAIGEEPERERCAQFLHQLDPAWDSRSNDDAS